MSSLRLFCRIDNRLTEFLPQMHAYRRRHLAWMIIGIHEAQHVHLSKVAAYRPGAARLPSKTRRLRRFLANEAVEPGRYYRPMARVLLEEAAQAHDELRLLLDIVELPGERQVLMLALAFRRRALPIMWHVGRGRGKTTARDQVAFLKDFEALLVGLFPEKIRPIIIADGEFHAVELIEYLDAMGWGFRLRLPASTRVHRPNGRRMALSEVALRSGHRRYLQDVYLTDLPAYGPLSVAASWAEGEDTPWFTLPASHSLLHTPCFIVTDEAEANYLTLRMYSRRMWIEELFGDLQGGGLQLHRSRLYAPERLARLLIAVCLVYLWLMHVGASVIKRGWRKFVDRTDRRGRSLTAIGRHWIRRALTHEKIPRIGFVPYF